MIHCKCFTSKVHRRRNFSARSSRSSCHKVCSSQPSIYRLNTMARHFKDRRRANTRHGRIHQNVMWFRTWIWFIIEPSKNVLYSFKKYSTISTIDCWICLLFYCLTKASLLFDYLKLTSINKRGLRKRNIYALQKSALRWKSNTSSGKYSCHEALKVLIKFTY